MYEYPKEILVLGRNTNQPLTTANIGGYFIFDIASCREPARKMYRSINKRIRRLGACRRSSQQHMIRDPGQEVVSHRESMNYKFLLSYNIFPSEISCATKTTVKMVQLSTCFVNFHVKVDDKTQVGVNKQNFHGINFSENIRHLPKFQYQR